MATEASLLTSLKALLVAQTWTGSANVVFPTGCVAITADSDIAVQQAYKTMRTPWALLQPMDSDADPEYDEDPNLAFLNLKVRIAVMVPGDALGENPLMGANKTGGSTRSEGRGLFEIEPELWTAIGKVNALEGIVLQCRLRGAIASQYHADTGTWVAHRDWNFQAIGTFV